MVESVTKLPIIHKQHNLGVSSPTDMFSIPSPSGILKALLSFQSFHPTFATSQWFQGESTPWRCKAKNPVFPKSKIPTPEGKGSAHGRLWEERKAWLIFFYISLEWLFGRDKNKHPWFREVSIGLHITASPKSTPQKRGVIFDPKNSTFGARVRSGAASPGPWKLSAQLELKSGCEVTYKVGPYLPLINGL